MLHLRIPRSRKSCDPESLPIQSPSGRRHLYRFVESLVVDRGPDCYLNIVRVNAPLFTYISSAVMFSITTEDAEFHRGELLEHT